MTFINNIRYLLWRYWKTLDGTNQIIQWRMPLILARGKAATSQIPSAVTFNSRHSTTGFVVRNLNTSAQGMEKG
jgi:hypothetical protein